MTNIWFENRALFVITRKIFVVTIFKKFRSSNFIRFETIEIISSRMHTARIVLNYAFYYVAIILFILSLYYIVIGNHNDGRLLIFPGIFLARFKAKTYD